MRTVTVSTDRDEDITERWTRPLGAHIVIVEDDRKIQEEMAARLRHEGYVVHGMLCGSELLRVLDIVASKPRPFEGVDLFVVDPHCAGVSPLEALRKLRAATDDLPILALPESSILGEAARLRVEVLAPPVSLDHLADAVLLTLLSRTTTALRAQSA